MMVLDSIKSLQAAESMAPVVKLHLTQRERQRLFSFSWLCLYSALVCFLHCVTVGVFLQWKCAYSSRLGLSRTLH